MVDRRQLAGACEQLYRRAGASTSRSGVHADLGEALQLVIQSSAGEVEGELPIVASVVDNEHWLYATTDRVVFRKGREVKSLPLNQVQEVHSLALEDANNGRDDIIVLMANGQRHEVQIEPGYPMGGIWNVLRRLLRAWGN